MYACIANKPIRSEFIASLRNIVRFHDKAGGWLYKYERQTPSCVLSVEGSAEIVPFSREGFVSLVELWDFSFCLKLKYEGKQIKGKGGKEKKRKTKTYLSIHHLSLHQTFLHLPHLLLQPRIILMHLLIPFH